MCVSVTVRVLMATRAFQLKATRVLPCYLLSPITRKRTKYLFAVFGFQYYDVWIVWNNRAGTNATRHGTMRFTRRPLLFNYQAHSFERRVVFYNRATCARRGSCRRHTLGNDSKNAFLLFSKYAQHALGVCCARFRRHAI